MARPERITANLLELRCGSMIQTARAARHPCSKVGRHIMWSKENVRRSWAALGSSEPCYSKHIQGIYIGSYRERLKSSLGGSFEVLLPLLVLSRQRRDGLSLKKKRPRYGDAVLLGPFLVLLGNRALHKSPAPGTASTREPPCGSTTRAASGASTRFWRLPRPVILRRFTAF